MQQQITEFGKSLGFDLIAFSPAKIEGKHLEAFSQWINNGYQAEMDYMKKIQRRFDMTKTLPNAKSVICLATNYYYPQKELKSDHARVARYAYGRDYHKIIGKKLKKFTQYLREIAPDHQHKAYVDTGPVLERALAEQSGIGSIGKNSCLITPKFGSWVFLSEIITTLELQPTSAKTRHWQAESDRNFKVCGNCTKCIDACPTGAIIAPGVIDSSLCISYLTIEHKGEIPPELAKKIKKAQLIYGCDICQEVCPHNQARQKIHTHPQFSEPKIAGDQINLSQIPKSDQEYLDRFAGSAFMRPKRKGLQRNADSLS